MRKLLILLILLAGCPEVVNPETGAVRTRTLTYEMAYDNPAEGEVVPLGNPVPVGDTGWVRK